MSNIEDFIQTELNKRLSQRNEKRSTQRLIQESRRDSLGYLSEDKTKVLLSTGETRDAVVVGDPQRLDNTIELIDGKAVVANDFTHSLNLDLSEEGFIIIKDPFLVPLLQHKYYLIDVSRPTIQYEIDAYGLAGLPPATAESGDLVKFIGFSSMGNHILVGAVIQNDDRENPVTLKWAILKNFEVNGNPTEPAIDYTLETGTYEIENDSFNLATDPGAPGPASLELHYHREQSGTGPDPSCPWNEPMGIPGATYHVSSYEEDIRWDLETTSDPSLLELQDPGPDLNIIDYTYTFSEDAIGEPVVDFVFSFTSVYRRFSIYQLKKKTTEVNFESINKQYEEGCENFCTTTFTKNRVTVEEYTHGPVAFAVKSNKDYVSNPCLGYNESGALVRQTRSLSSSAETTLQCERAGVGGGEFCFDAQGDCLDPGAADASLACPEGFPTCTYEFENECPLGPYPNYLTEAALPCDYNTLPFSLGSMVPDSMNWSMKEKTTKGIVAIAKLNSLVTIDQLETSSQLKTNLLTTTTSTRGPCNQPINAPIGWEPMTATGGGIEFTYWTRTIAEEPLTGIRYSVLNKRGFRDPTTGATAAVYLDTDSGNAIWFTPYTNRHLDIGPVVDPTRIAVSNEVSSNDGFSADTDTSLFAAPYFLFASEARSFRNYRSGPNFPKIKLRNWTFTEGTFEKTDLVEGEWNNQAFLLQDFILRK